MTTATLIPTEDQTQLMLESPMTDSELSQLEAIESRGCQSAKTETMSKIERALCLLEVYNDKLFRGKAGGRTWGQYLQSIDLAKLGFVNGLETETAVNWMNFGALCEAIDDWNDANPDRPALPYPARAKLFVKAGPCCLTVSVNGAGVGNGYLCAQLLAQLMP